MADHLDGRRTDASREPDGIVLFVGNSLTYRGGGLDRHFGKIAPQYTVDRVVKGGATLADLMPAASSRLARGSIDILVLQEDIPETSVEAFLESVRRYAALARDTGCRPLLLMSWPYPRLDWIGVDGIAAAHGRAALETGMSIVPAALAWERSRLERPELELYAEDREHPSIAGSYLAASCLVRVLGLSPMIRTEYRPGGLGGNDLLFLWKTAEETVRDFMGEGVCIRC